MRGWWDFVGDGAGVVTSLEAKDVEAPVINALPEGSGPEADLSL